MKRLFTPTWIINSIYHIKPEDLMHHHISGVIVDLDNTLIAWHKADHSEEMAEWIASLRQAGIQVYLLSNNNKKRIERVAQPLELEYSALSLKPSRKEFKKALTYLALPKEEVVVIGDQLLTDIVGANRMKLRSILVKPIDSQDIIYTIPNRIIERWLFKLLKIDRLGDWGDTLD